MRYDAPRGPVAMPAKAWGEEFAFLLFGDDDPRPPYTEEGRYAVVDVCGPLTQQPGWWGESYVELRERMAAAFASSSDSVCMKIDSPGGDYAGCLELSRDLRAMAQASGKEFVAFTEATACSAAYALATAADSIVTTESAQIGSVGVWAPMLDVTAQDAMYGVKVVIASSGKAKADRNPHTGISDEAFARLQSQIDDMAMRFFELVAEHRVGVDVERVRALEGADFFGSRGLAAGLSDRIVNSWQAFLSEEASPMKVGASKYDEAMGALKRAAEGDDEDAKKAKKALKAIEDGDKPTEETEEEKKKREDEARAAEEEKEKAAANAIKLAAEVAALKAKDAARDAADAKAKADAELAAFWATRPDVGEEQRKSLDGLPVERVKAIVATWPRVTARPGASASATVPAVSGGERQTNGGAERPLSTEEQAVFDRTDPFKRSKTSAKASLQGSEFTMPARMITNEEAAARVVELEKEFGGN